LDVGCNTGRYAFAAAEAGARVVAIDSDEPVVGHVFQEARRRTLDVLPLVVDLARPSPASGWRNAENLAFLDRARGRFDGVLMLAVVHHLLVTEGIPLDEILEGAADLTRKFAVVEFVPRDDPMFLRLTRGRDDLYTWLDQAAFEAACARHFRIGESLTLPGSRTVYVLVRP
jgi:SAM-dependent methyltransferase